MNEYFIGVDLGQQSDYTALSVTQRLRKPVGEPEYETVDVAMGTVHDPLLGSVERVEQRLLSRRKAEDHYQVGYLRRVRGKPYTDIARSVKALTEEDLLRGKCAVVVDATGVGRAVVDIMRSAALPRMVPITITGGDKPSRDGNEYRVPKRDLASTVQVLLQSRRLHFAQGLPEGEAARRELMNFKAKINLRTGHDTYAADWREGEHDDLVLSLALALWYAEYAPKPAVIFGKA